MPSAAATACGPGSRSLFGLGALTSSGTSIQAPAPRPSLRWWDDAPRLARLMIAIAEWEGRGHISDAAFNAAENARGRYQMRDVALHDVLGRWPTEAEMLRLHDPDYAGRMFVAYLRLYCEDTATDEVLARAWNGGGPAGPYRKCTLKYWAGVKGHLDADML